MAICFIKNILEVVFMLTTNFTTKVKYLLKCLKFAFLYVHVKTNSKEICEELSFSSFSKNADVSIFVYDLRLIKLTWRNAWLTPVSLRISRALAIREGSE